jgi:hypothetical protein
MICRDVPPSGYQAFCWSARPRLSRYSAGTEEGALAYWFVTRQDLIDALGRSHP